MATLYGANAQSQTTSDLYTINPVTGTPTSVGPIGYAVTAMAWDPIGSVMYGMTSNNSAASPRNLITINLGTGAGTVVGPLGLGATSSASDMTFTSDGQLWGIRTSNGRLMTINKTTGAGAEVGTSGGFGNALVTTDSDQFVGITFNTGQWFYWLVPQSGGQDKVAGDFFGTPPIFGGGGASVGADGFVYIANAGGGNGYLDVANLTTLTIVNEVSSLSFFDAIAWNDFFTLTFGPAPTTPTVVYGAVTTSWNTGLIHATINPNSSGDTTWQVQYGTTTGYGHSSLTLTIPDGGSPVSISRLVGVASGFFASLNASTLYHYRIVATNNVGTATGADHTFTTDAYPGSPPANDDIA